MTSQHNLYIETYGCQMNQNDTEIVSGIMAEGGYGIAENLNNADIILLNTCSVRDNAEERILNRVETLFHLLKKRKTPVILGVIGCMAERLQDRLLSTNEVISLVVGPDEYRKLPELARLAFEGNKGVAVDLSTIETYNDVIPLRTNGISAWISIMRGCNNFCSYCVVPYTRGRERSRPFDTIVDEAKSLWNNGIKEIALLGQNVNSYSYNDANFPKLLRTIAQELPKIRLRFVTSHPRDMSDELINTIAEFDNICKYIHLPVQSGSNRILQEMNRKYTIEHYLGLIEKIRTLMPHCGLSTDIIAGYPSETLDEHQATLDLFKMVKYDSAFMFKYSPREGTKAFSKPDTVSEEEKIRRLNEIIKLQNQISRENNHAEIGKTFAILVENASRKKATDWFGRTDTNKVVLFDNSTAKHTSGDIVNVRIIRSTGATLFGELIT